MKPCSSPYCPNAAGPTGVCDDCNYERSKPTRCPTPHLVTNKTGRLEYVLTAEEWRTTKTHGKQ